MADEPLSVDALLAWGRDYLRQLEARPDDSALHVPLAVLKQYFAKGNEGLALLKQRDERTTNRAGGRPRGSGMGGLAAALIARGTREDDAVRAAAEHYGKPINNVSGALQRHRTGKRKKPT